MRTRYIYARTLRMSHFQSVESFTSLILRTGDDINTEYSVARGDRS